jgi:hypothetical protein
VEGNKTRFSFSSFSKLFFFLFQLGIRVGAVCFWFRACVAHIGRITFSLDWLPLKTHVQDFLGKPEMFWVVCAIRVTGAPMPIETSHYRLAWLREGGLYVGEEAQWPNVSSFLKNL